MPASEVSASRTAQVTASSLDRDSFQESLCYYALRIPPKLCNSTRKAIKQHALLIPRVQSVQKENEFTLLLLKYFATKPLSTHNHAPRGNSDISLVNEEPEKVASVINNTTFPTKTPENISQFVQNLSSKDITTTHVKIGYEHWSAESVLRELLPEGVVVPTSFETVGHLVHLNLRDEHEPYKKLIGTVLLSKLQPRIKTIVNKLASTGGPYRTFAMEVLAGEDNTVTKVKQNGCTFAMDFAKVYWNSRLEHEHMRIVKLLQPDDILVDAFCGIGPFVVPAAKKKLCKEIYANDLNPDSIKYLSKNLRDNNIVTDQIKTTNGCARKCLRKLRNEKVNFTRLVMNFPAGAPEFLDSFRGLYYDCDEQKPPMPIVHCYCFVKSKTDMQSARLRVRKALFGDNSGTDILSDDMIDVREVRDVAPNKIQVCVTFQVPEKVAYMAPTSEAPATKRQKTS